MRAMNHNEGKSKWSTLFGDFYDAFIEVLEARRKGCEKYPRDNWSQSIGTDDHDRFCQDNLDSILRHTLALTRGEQRDEESGCHHGAHIVLRGLFAICYWKRNG